MAGNKTDEKWTVVQHSGFGYKGDRTFEKGLEIRSAHTKAVQDRVNRAGGILFDSWPEADKFCDEAMYPEDNKGLAPRAAGSFSEQSVDGLRIYVPVRQVTG